MTPKIDYEEINKIIRLLEDRNLAEFELEIEDFKIKIRKNPPVIAVPPAASATPGLGGDFETGGDFHMIASPMVGTFYRAPSPASPPFVEVGDIVKKKQVLCIVEAMKLMNEIESDADGVVRDIFVENGKPVEYGQRLFAISPSA
ncbi:MAG: acetyl-CoA carboxylase biotin carboxyl carrier protein [Candidatus Aminicenantes bacterium]|nr:acetyl-CoA carboxylase biotin carboxyl carrier protein [Candidatus Aminicenantes bacterium]